MTKCRNCVVRLFGACGRNNSEYCRMERETLMDEARSLVKERGHELEEFFQVDDYTIWEARCVRCERTVRINLAPESGDLSLHGDALLHDCPEGQAAEASRTKNKEGLWD